ncbi:MAG: 3-isopropylmalate dehydrogenase, partial [Gammaproteobacteria bacterium]
MSKKIAILPGDGIGPEIIAEAVKTLNCLKQKFDFDVELKFAAFGGAGYDEA